MCTVALAMVQAYFGRIRMSARAPMVALILISVLSLGARSLLLDEPCQSPCTTASDHTLIFDEAYYVNAARVIAGIRPPAGAHYADAPLGTDPNAEHPQGAKLIMAAAIEIFGDGPFAWRIGSLLMGSLAILGMFALVRSAGGGRWTAVGAAGLMACDNLLLVHGRIGTLDIYALAPMIWGVALYLRGRVDRRRTGAGNRRLVQGGRALCPVRHRPDRARPGVGQHAGIPALRPSGGWQRRSSGWRPPPSSMSAGSSGPWRSWA